MACGGRGAARIVDEKLGSLMETLHEAVVEAQQTPGLLQELRAFKDGPFRTTMHNAFHNMALAQEDARVTACSQKGNWLLTLALTLVDDTFVRDYGYATSEKKSASSGRFLECYLCWLAESRRWDSLEKMASVVEGADAVVRHVELKHPCESESISKMMNFVKLLDLLEHLL